ncbi:hypothetical protein N658DRAFT_563296 [Parathielavia hyrcaniae]|uniref:TEL2-interacting protein 1 n=1 Tax=Parathielavia hyrcaniae TaxID=113614 RepID=A0AAN6QFG4_9PEZI|nr:hypothetical protein N658DRAFT_563296 [Parathielavia hyrcaniae]
MPTVSPLAQRTDFFQQLKRICVPLSQLALRPKDKAVDSKEVLRLLEALIDRWAAQASKDEAILDEKLADYVFFPLSYLLRDRGRYPMRVIEAIIRLLRELMQHGWKAKASPQLFQQLLVFLSFVIGGVPDQPKPDMPEETTIEGFRTLAALVSSAQPSHLAAPPDSPSESRVVPALGHISSIQLEAVECLRAFLPGTVSALTKVLSPPQANHTQRTVILSCLELLQLVLVNVLKLESLSQANANAEATTVVAATTAQIKIALAAILRLRSHESDIVQSTLHTFCITLLDQCHSSLADCQSMLVESAMVLEEDATSSRHQTSLQDLAGVYPELADSIKSAMYNWITGLPRVMQSSDERMCAAMQMDSSTLEDALGDSLRDSIITLIKSSKQPRIIDDAGADVSTSTDLVRSGLDSENQKTTRKEISALISSVGSPAQQIKLAASMLGHVRDSQGVDQVASFWLAFELVKSTYAQSSDIDDLHQDETFRELYDFSASVLSAHSDAVEEDWRTEAIALELDFRPELIDVLYPVTTFLGSPSRQLRAHAITTLNLIAASCGYDSVSDLIVDNADYMVNSISLRLNTFDISPESTKVLTMVVRLTGPRLIPFLDDVVAAIFAALDNYHGYPVFVESLFSVLSEVVTQGVKAIDHRKTKPESRLERATRSKQEEEEEKEKAKDAATLSHSKQPWAPPTKKDEATSLLDKLANPDPDQEDRDPNPPETDADQPLSKPKTPTYTLLTRVLALTQHHLTSPAPTLRKSLLDLVATVAPALAPDENAFLPLAHAVWPVALARLYDPEPYVAVAACGALAGLCRAAGDFLGSRFRAEWGKELGRWAGRVKGEVYGLRVGRNTGGGGGGLGLVGRRKDGGGAGMGSEGGILVPLAGGGGGGGGDGERVGAVKSSFSSSSSGAALGRFSQASQVWEAVLGLLTAMVGYVRIEDDMFDDILRLVVDVLPRHGELREVLETVNADAVWLALYERGLVQGRDAPVVEGFEFRFARMERGGGR